MAAVGKRKTNKSMLKRIKLTARGKALKRGCGMSHLMSGKSGNKRRKMRKAGLMPKTVLEKIHRLAGLR